MNISKTEQRILHALAQGGHIRRHRDARGHIIAIDCLTREGFRLETCDLAIFSRLKRRRFIASRDSGPYQITREGLHAVRAQLDNR